jgi:hypothetical protein
VHHGSEEVTAMPAIDIPDPLPPAITPDREVIEFLIERHLQEFGDGGLVARTWHWVLHGGSRGPISRMDWSRFDGDGPPSAATLAAESTASQPPLSPAVSWDELNRARFICWLCTSQPEDELPLRFHPWDAAPVPAKAGSVTITMREIRNA